jgi:hypothetical protein
MTQVLRYPYESITNSTDYLQISISAYEPAGTDLIRKNYTQTLNKTGGVILLPMPSNIQDGNSVSYADDSLDTISAKLAGGAGTIMTTALNKKNDYTQFGKDIVSNATKAVSNLFKGDGGSEMKDVILKSLGAQAASVFGNVTRDQLLAREGGQILNPNMELLFNGVTLRTFRFSFKMTPRDDKESEQIKYIIRSLKRNMAAKSGGTFLTAPNIFELTYRKGNTNHPFLHKFKPCALTDMAVNYTGENVYATYADGTPVSMTMDLTFKELVPIYDIDYTEGGKDDGKDLDTTVGY